jgi:hypothetical protein
MNFVRRTVRFAVVASFLVTTAAYAQPHCPTENGQIVVYFDRAGTQRHMDAGPAGSLVVVYVFGEDMDDNVHFVGSAGFQVDYGPNLRWLVDLPLYGAFIGNTRDGYAVGFGIFLPNGAKFPIVNAICEWTNDCAVGRNVDGPVVREHPAYPEPCPIVINVPYGTMFHTRGARSQTCQLVELDIKPGSCPNPYNIRLFDWAGSRMSPSVLPVAILGSESVDVNEIDPATLMLEGVPALRHDYDDVATLDGHGGCDCNDGDADGHMDMTVKFDRQAIAMALLLENPPHVGQQLPLTLTGAYYDGMPFEATDCITLVGSAREKKQAGLKGASGLGFPTPNPFNPVTRTSYNVSSTQHVRIAIYDVAGRLVETLVDETKSAGEYVVEWDAGSLPSGVYFYHMETGDETIVRRATLLK